MIGSRTQAKVDYWTVAALAGLAVWPGVAGRTRLAAAAAAAAFGASAALTDYEGGLAPRIGLREHQLFGAAGGAALLGWGRGSSRALSLLGALQLCTVLAARHRPDGHPPDMTYKPLDTLKPLAPDVWTVDSVMNPIPLRMTVIRLPGGGLLLHSPTRPTPALLAAIAAIGPVEHVVAPSTVHWMFAKPWQDRFPDATTWGAPVLADRGQVRRAGLRIDRVLGDLAPAAWGGVIEQTVVRGGVGRFCEVVMFHVPSRSVLITDIVQSFEPGKTPWPLRPIARALGNAAPESRAPRYLRAVVRLDRNAAAARTIAGWAPERIVVSHGAIIATDAAATLHRSLSWLR